MTEKRAPVSTDVKMDISGVSVTKVRHTKGKHTFLRPFIVYKFTNVQIHTHVHCLTICLSVCRSVGRSVGPSVRPFIYPSIHPSIYSDKLKLDLLRVFQLVLLVNTDQTAEKYVDIVTTTQSVTMVMGHVWRDVKPVIGTIIVKHVRYFLLTF